MRLLVLFLILVLCTGHPAAAQIQPSSFSSRLELQFQRQMLYGIVLPDSHAAITPLGATSMDNGTLLRDGAQSPSYFSLTAHPLRFYGLEQYELTTFDCTIMGMDEGLKMGLFLGAIGTTTGMLEENSIWYIAGAMTAMGALLGLKSSADNPTFRTRYRWEEE